MNISKASLTKTRHCWSEEEESLLLALWESNIRNLENAGIRKIYNKIHQEMSFHFNHISRFEIKSKVRYIRGNYKKALTNKEFKQHWTLFDRVHTIMDLYRKAKIGNFGIKYNRRIWSAEEESLLFDIWESNIKEFESTAIARVNRKIHSEFYLQFDISLADMTRKMCNTRRDYRKALVDKVFKKRWKLFDRVHKIMNLYPNAKAGKFSRDWSTEEESLFFDIWESNIKDLEISGLCVLQERMYDDLSLCLNVTRQDMIKKKSAVRQQYRRALANDEIKKDWKQFERVHRIMKAYQKVKRTHHSVQSGNPIDECENTIDACQEFIDCDANGITIKNESETNTYELTISKENIKLEDDIEYSQKFENVINTNSTESSAFEQIENQQNIISAELLTLTTPKSINSVEEDLEKQFAPIRAIQTLDETGLSNFNYLPALSSTLAGSSEFAPRLHLRQPVQPQRNNSTDVAIANSESAFNLLQTPTTCSQVANELAQQKSDKTAVVQPIKENDDILGTMLKTLTTIDGNLRQFIQSQDNLSQKIYCESLRNNLLLTQILEDSQRRTKLMELLIAQKSGSNETIITN